MCGSNPELPAAANKAKCMGIGAFVLSILSIIGFLVHAIPSGIGGLLSCIAASILMCCGPKPGDGGGKLMVVCVMFGLSAILHIIGGILALVWYLGVLSDANDVCRGESDSWCNEHKDAVIGWVGLFVFPVLAVAILAAIFEILAAIYAFKGKQAMSKVLPNA